MTHAVWSAAVDALVYSHPSLGMDLARSRVAVIEFSDGEETIEYLQVKADPARTAWFRDHRRETEAHVIQALRAFGLDYEAVAFVEEWVR